jgi:glutamate formiminotransferase/formiminotetrahydrofolate cyclodeaminase
MGAFMNVRINARAYDDKNFVDEIIAKGKEIEDSAAKTENEILKIVNEKIGV